MEHEGKGVHGAGEYYIAVTLVASDLSLLGALFFTLLVSPSVLILITRHHTAHVVCVATSPPLFLLFFLSIE